MILNHFFFIKKFYRSSASRNNWFFFSKWNLNNKINKIKHLTIKKINKSGRNDTGRIVARTKTSKLIKIKQYKLNYNLRCFKMGFVAAFTFIPFKNKILSLMLFNDGSISYYLTANSHNLFLVLSPNFFFKKLKKLKTRSLFFMLFQIKKLSFISCLELFPGKNSQYIRSSGTKGKIISFDKSNHTVLIQLPSKLKKIFSYYSFVTKDSISLSMHKKCFNGKFGFWRSFGIKPLSRGIAKNPVDHPNGGRTKSLKYSKTPWGKTTKFK